MSLKYAILPWSVNPGVQIGLKLKTFILANTIEVFISILLQHPVISDTFDKAHLDKAHQALTCKIL